MIIMNTENAPDVDIKYPAYYVTGSTTQGVKKASDDTVLVAIDVTFKDGIVKWYDTQKERSFIYDSISQTFGDEIVFTCLTNRLSYTLTPLSLEIFDMFVRSKIAGESPYANNGELWESLLATKLNEW